jgi:nitric oxide reductase NorE protein
MFYFMLTGIHLLHLVVGLILLVATMLHLRRVRSPGRAINEELVGFSSCFWHMIDIVWIVLFPLLYLLQ